MKLGTKILITTMAVIILSNLPPISGIFRFFLDEKHYRYSNFDGSFTSYEFMSRDFKLMKRLHQACLSDYPNQKDKKLYRLFNKNPFAFWRWRLYFFDERYKLTYRNWEEVKELQKSGKELMKCHTDFD